MKLFRRRRDRAMDKLRLATRRVVDLVDEVVDGPQDDGKKAMKEVRRVLKRDVPRYFKRLPVPRDYRDIQSLTLRDWLYLTPLLLVLAVIVQYSVWLLLVIVFLLCLVNA